jgi:hypothetical protein
MFENVSVLADLHIKFSKNANLTKRYLLKVNTGIEFMLISNSLIRAQKVHIKKIKSKSFADLEFSRFLGSSAYDIF